MAISTDIVGRTLAEEIHAALSYYKNKADIASVYIKVTIFYDTPKAWVVIQTHDTSSMDYQQAIFPCSSSVARSMAARPWHATGQNGFYKSQGWSVYEPHKGINLINDLPNDTELCLDYIISPP